MSEFLHFVLIEKHMAKHNDDDDNDSWWQFLLIGVLMVITPIVQLMKDGVRSDSDMIQWIINKPLGYHQFIRFTIIAGVSLIFLGLAWFYL